MSSTASKTLVQLLKQSVPAGSYYICGEDEFQKEHAMKKLIAGALDPSVRDFNLDVLRAQDIDPKSFDGIVSSMPMMSEARVVVIRDAGLLRKNARQALERFLERPARDVVLLMVEVAGGKKDKELMERGTVLEFQTLAPDEVPGWIMHWATRETGAEISPGAIELLQTAVGNDLHQLVMELDKLASYTIGETITEDAVAQVVGIRRGETMTDLLDAVSRRDVTTSLGLLNHVLSQPKTTGVQIVMLLSAQTVALAWGRAKLNEGLAHGRLQSEYFNLLKQAGSAYTGRSWASAGKSWAAASDDWDNKSLNRAFDALLTADVALKESRLSSEEQVLTTLILAMCAGDEQKIAA